MSSDGKTDEAVKPEQNESPQSESPDINTASSLSLASLQKHILEKLQILVLDDAASESVSPKILNDTSLDGVVAYINKKGCKNVITMAGAGISTSAGIPDFRSAGTGLYHNLQKYELPCPEAIFHLPFFRKNPKPFFVLAKELFPGAFKPSASHYFIRLLHENGMLLRHYTQNIDALERVAGIPDEKLVEAHGTCYTGHCLECRKKYDLKWLKEIIFKDEIPICEKCPGIVKPDIVFFGENLPEKFYNSIDVDFGKCDLLIILGSSLEVNPFASLIDMPSSTTPRLLINREKAGHRTGVMALTDIPGGLEYDRKGNTRDVAWLGDCDDGCQLLADKLGWGEKLKEMVRKEHKKLDQSNTEETAPSIPRKIQAPKP